MMALNDDDNNNNDNDNNDYNNNYKNNVIFVNKCTKYYLQPICLILMDPMKDFDVPNDSKANICRDNKLGIFLATDDTFMQNGRIDPAWSGFPGRDF